MINENFVILGAILVLVGGWDYFVDTVRGNTKPNRVTWFLWALAPLIAFTAEIKQGVGILSLATFIAGFVPLLVLLGSFINKKSVWKLTLIDAVCGLLSLIGLILWYITKVGNIAILFSIIADALAAIPTLLKSYRDPESESSLLYLLVTVSAIIALLTIKEWNFQSYGFQIYLLLVDFILFLLVKFKLGKLTRRA
ncbi:hypothetical protein HZC27_03815 [Candidatus Roizmanbacteria bacterium]|nr:hypothetical protein [Candidatus Roizmanbacteria bacterium]